MVLFSLRIFILFGGNFFECLCCTTLDILLEGISIRFLASQKAKWSRSDLVDKNMVSIVVQYSAEILSGLHGLA